MLVWPSGVIRAGLAIAARCGEACIKRAIVLRWSSSLAANDNLLMYGGFLCIQYVYTSSLQYSYLVSRVCVMGVPL